MTLCPELRRLAAEHARWASATPRRPREGEAAYAGRLLGLWEREILPHCRAEEEVLLPELSRRISEADALVVFTLGDHVVLRRLARELREASGDQTVTAAERLATRIADHFAFEEKALLPALQENLGCARMAALAREIAKADASPQPS